MTPILHAFLPHDILPGAAKKPLPGIAPADPDDWLRVDATYPAQMAERERLLTTRRKEVLQVLPEAAPAATELLDMALTWAEAQGGFARDGSRVTRPDGVTVTIKVSDPLGTLGRLFQQDLCILERRGDEHALTAAVLCFPASWTLSEKIGRPLTAIHRPVAPYSPDIARRVQRLFDGVRPGRPIWRANALGYDSPALFHPCREGAPHETRADARFLRCERQVILRLPGTNAVVFTIHTHVVARENLTPAQVRAMVEG
ncbi:MAG: DUF3445 domain-containing protein [Alphaproteobacteria bacterium]|nr:DUF3445 domain-containing protein [Alphaproteobacteria bacterium]